MLRGFIELDFYFVTVTAFPVGGGGVLLGIVGGGVPPGFPNPDPISDQNRPFSTPVFRSPV